mmetsp:Transcript_11697/g.29725  ORF Transcript_11697/g.29725 Transcript_11697/m.29725 type:complete len:213 (+) Transcript_11697:131-769(+)
MGICVSLFRELPEAYETKLVAQPDPSYEDEDLNGGLKFGTKGNIRLFNLQCDLSDHAIVLSTPMSRTDIPVVAFMENNELIHGETMKPIVILEATGKTKKTRAMSVRLPEEKHPIGFLRWSPPEYLLYPVENATNPEEVLYRAVMADNNKRFAIFNQNDELVANGKITRNTGNTLIEARVAENQEARVIMGIAVVVLKKIMETKVVRSGELK